MAIKDSVGYIASGATPESLAAYEQGCRELRCFIDDPVATVDQALHISPEMTMAYALKAWLHLLGTEPAGLDVARNCLQAANQLPSTDRERGHLEAIRLLLEGRWAAAGQTLEDVTAHYPHDGLALQAGHAIDFYTGDSRMLRDRIARALPAWSDAHPGYHAVLGMYAFGLEECGAYDEAERYGRESVECESRDTWAWHAVAHTFEMRNRTQDGIEWLRSGRDAWSRDSFFAVHNWWHLALFHLDRGNIDAAIHLFDGPIHGKRSTVVLDLIDASALLWRLHLRGIDVGERWSTVADAWSSTGIDGNYAFNDWHAMMAYVGSDRKADQERVLEALTNVMRGETDSARFAREVGFNAARAIQAFGAERYADAVQLLRPIRSRAHRFGGSHAQRDLIDLTLIEAALRAGMQSLSTALAAERAARIPTSPLSRLFVQRAVQADHGSQSGDEDGRQDALTHAGAYADTSQAAFRPHA